MTGCKFFNAIAFSLAIASPTGAEALDLRVLSGSGVQPVMSEIIPRFESGSGHRVIFDYGTVGGMAARIQDGEFADVIIASEPQIAELEKHSKIVFGSRTDLAKTGIGIFVRKGTPKPDISSVDSFKRTMLASKSIGWNDPVAGAPVSIYMLGVFERLGISQEMKSKTVVFKQRSERFEAVARGDVEIGLIRSVRSWPQLVWTLLAHCRQPSNITRYSALALWLTAPIRMRLRLCSALYQRPTQRQ